MGALKVRVIGVWGVILIKLPCWAAQSTELTKDITIGVRIEALIGGEDRVSENDDAALCARVLARGSDGQGTREILAPDQTRSADCSASDARFGLTPGLLRGG